LDWACWDGPLKVGDAVGGGCKLPSFLSSFLFVLDVTAET
jgi:hypothetical protein